MGADVVITGREADPALFAAPLIYEYGWDWQNAKQMGQKVLIGYLLECVG